MMRSRVASESPLGRGSFRPDRTAARLGSTHDLEAVHALDIGAMELRDSVVVVDHESANHVLAVTLAGTRTVKSAPPSLTTSTPPPFRRATCRTSARPKPRRL